MCIFLTNFILSILSKIDIIYEKIAIRWLTLSFRVLKFDFCAFQLVNKRNLRISPIAERESESIF
jgi:hypothetical protein